MVPTGDILHMDGGAERVQHLHLLQHVFTAGGTDDQQLTTLQMKRKSLQYIDKCIQRQKKRVQMHINDAYMKVLAFT